MVTILMGVVIVGLLAYIHRLRAQLRGYEHVWEQIESIADRNQDGTFTIHIQHLEDAHQDEDVLTASEVPDGERPSGIHILDLDNAGVLRLMSGKKAS